MAEGMEPLGIWGLADKSKLSKVEVRSAFNSGMHSLLSDLPRCGQVYSKLLPPSVEGQDAPGTMLPHWHALYP